MFKVVCFDMDGTLITNTNSVEYLCNLNGKAKEVKDIEIKEEKDEISWIEADFIKAKLFAGLEVRRIKEEFNNYVGLIGNIDEVLKELKKNEILSILVTAGPIQVAEVLGKMFDFDKVYGSLYEIKVYGSLYEIKNDVFTGSILKHLGDSGKLDCLIEFCSEKNISLDEVVSIGDSASDIKVFEKSGKSIAINYSNKLNGKADVYIKTKDLLDVLGHIR